MKVINYLFAIVASTLLLSSCASTSKIVYMEDANTVPQSAWSQITYPEELSAVPGDLMEITVTSRNAESAKLYNKGTYFSGINTGTSSNTADYLVDKSGNIEFPVLGTLHVGGMKKDEIRELIISKLYPNHLVEMPSVEVRFKNMQVTMLGEVKNPGVKKSDNEQLNILDAIAMAGDLTIYGVRNDIMLIRTESDGSRSIHSIDINDKNLLLSPYFNLKQNDVIYVKPNKTKQRSSWSIPAGWTLGVSTLGTLMSVITFVIALSKK